MPAYGEHAFGVFDLDGITLFCRWIYYDLSCSTAW
jgi:hypothetical protein